MEKQDNKTLYAVMAILVIAVIASGYFFMQRNGNEDVVSTEGAGQGSENAVLDPNFVISLSQIESFKLNKDIFLDEDFLGLKDISATVNSEPKGRKNPFAPI